MMGEETFKKQADAGLWAIGSYTVVAYMSC